MTAATQLSTKDLMAGFNVAHMTIYNWRQGTPTKDPLPCIVRGRSVSFDARRTAAWAKKYGIAFKMPTVPAAKGRPGPKSAGKKKAPVQKRATAVKQKSARRRAPA